VLAVACSHPVTTAAGKRLADELAAGLPRQAWQRLSAGQGSKGPHLYDWAWITIDPDRPRHRWLLIRRSNTAGDSWAGLPGTVG
jgi:hypothetical protein